MSMLHLEIDDQNREFQPPKVLLEAFRNKHTSKIELSTHGYRVKYSTIPPNFFYRGTPLEENFKALIPKQFLHYVFADRQKNGLLPNDFGKALSTVQRFISLYKAITTEAKDVDHKLESYNDLKSQLRDGPKHSILESTYSQSAYSFSKPVGAYISRDSENKPLRYRLFKIENMFADFNAYTDKIKFIENEIRQAFFPRWNIEDTEKLFSGIYTDEMNFLLKLSDSSCWQDITSAYLFLIKLAPIFTMAPQFTSIFETEIIKRFEVDSENKYTETEMIKELISLNPPAIPEKHRSQANFFFDSLLTFVIENPKKAPQYIHEIKLLANTSKNNHYISDLLKLANAFPEILDKETGNINRYTESSNSNIFIKVSSGHNALKNIYAFCQSINTKPRRYHHSMFIMNDNSEDSAYLILARTYHAPTLEYLSSQYKRSLPKKQPNDNYSCTIVGQAPLSKISQIEMLLDNVLGYIDQSGNTTLGTLAQNKILTKLCDYEVKAEISPYTEPMNVILAHGKGYHHKAHRIPQKIFSSNNKAALEKFKRNLQDSLQNKDPRALFHLLTEKNPFSKDSDTLLNHLSTLQLSQGHYAYAYTYFYVAHYKSLPNNNQQNSKTSHNSTPIELDFSERNLNSSHLKRIAELSKKNIQISRLNLSANTLTHNDRGLISNIIKSHPLKQLNLSHNKLGILALGKIMKTVKLHTRDKRRLHINLSNCWIIINTKQKLELTALSILEMRKHRVELDLSANFISLDFSSKGPKHIFKQSRDILSTYVDQPISSIIGNKLISPTIWSVSLLSETPTSTFGLDEHMRLTVEGLDEGGLRFIFVAHLVLPKPDMNIPEAETKPQIEVISTHERIRNKNIKHWTSSKGGNLEIRKKCEPFDLDYLLRLNENKIGSSNSNRSFISASICTANTKDLKKMMMKIRKEATYGLGKEYAMLSGFDHSSPENTEAYTNCNKWALNHLAPFLPKEFAKGSSYYRPSTAVADLIIAIDPIGHQQHQDYLDRLDLQNRGRYNPVRLSLK